MDKEKLWGSYVNEKNPTKKKDLKNKLIESYVDLVRIVSGKLFVYYGKNIEFEDLVGYGVIGLIDAIDKFDITKNIKFETYASIRIRGTIIDQIRNVDWIPRSIRQKSKSLSKTIEKLEEKIGRTPSREELASELNISLIELDNLQNECNVYNIVSVEDEIIENYRYNLTDNKIENLPEESLIVKDKVNELSKAIDTLKDREKLIVNLYYYENLTYKEISKIVDVSESRISQIINSSLEKLRKVLKNNL